MNIGILPTKTKEIIDILNGALADEFILSLKTRKAHWNIQGLAFNSLHKLFQGQYEDADGSVDDLAERVRQMGGFPMATTIELRDKSKIKESAESPTDPKIIISDLLKDHEEIIKSLRVSIPKTDLGSANMLTDMIQAHEKAAWMLRASIS